jgi:ferritin-like metal-binding protein YciE
MQTAPKKQALRCMQKALKMASAPALREGIEMHIDETQVQIERVEQAMERLEVPARPQSLQSDARPRRGGHA